MRRFQRFSFICIVLITLTVCALLSGSAQKSDMLGDVSGDQSIAPYDALLVLQHTVSLIKLTPEQLEQADVNSSGRADTTDALLILQFSVGLIQSFVPNEMATPGIVRTKYPTPDVVIADEVATNPGYGADRTGVDDSTYAIQSALNICAMNGGGTVWLPAGKYRVTGPIVIPSFVTLRGDWQDPDEGQEYGTIILADVESTPADTPALFTIGGSAGAVGLTVYYPHQTMDSVKPYPYTFYVDGAGDRYMLQTVRNCTVINGYKGIGACVSEDNAHEMLTVDNVKGTFLYRGATAYNQADVGTWKNITLSSKYWAEAGAGLTSADRSQIEEYTGSFGVGLSLGDLEWTQFNNIRISGYRTGIQIVPGKRIQFAGSFYDTTITNCDFGIAADELDPRWGMLLARSRIEAKAAAVDNRSDGLVKMAGVEYIGVLNGNVYHDPQDLSADAIDYQRRVPRPAEHFYLAGADPDRQTDISQTLQTALDRAGTTGGVVYLPAGIYRLDHPVTVPAGVELRGCSSVGTREQGGNSSGTLILAYYGQTDRPDSAQALVTLAGNNAGVRGIRFLYPENSAVTPGRLGTCLPYAYTIRGQAEGVYAVHIGLSGAYNGIDFRGCNNHTIRQLVCCCYNNAISAGNCTGGWIQDCLQNGNMLCRNGLDSSIVINVESDQLFPYVFDAITRPNTKFIRLGNAQNQTVMSSFAYGVNSLIHSDNSSVFVCNVGADNLGGAMLEVSGGSFTGVNLMRWNGESVQQDGGRLRLINRLTIGDKTEPNLF